MQYVRSMAGSASKAWNSINPATLSGAVDVIVIEQEDGSLACSPFHVRFGKWQLLRPSDKKVQFIVNEVKQDFAMKLGEGGEAYFVFETTESIPRALQTSPLASPAQSPTQGPSIPPELELPEPDSLDLSMTSPAITRAALEDARPTRPPPSPLSRPLDVKPGRPKSTEYSDTSYERSLTDDVLPSTKAALRKSFEEEGRSYSQPPEDSRPTSSDGLSPSPPPTTSNEAVTRAINLSKKLWNSNIPTQVTEKGDLMLDITGYKSSEEHAIRAEVIARKLLSEELEGDCDIGALTGVDENGNVWIYSSEEAKEAANRKADLSGKLQGLQPVMMRSTDAISDPGYHSDDNQSDSETVIAESRPRRDSDSAVGLTSAPHSPEQQAVGGGSNFAKTLRLTSDQLKKLNLHPGVNQMSFTVNRATCQAFIYLWDVKTPVVISDIDGTITKSDVLGHVLNTLGRDWTHLGVAKLYTDIVSNGYNILYLTSRSIGQADTTRAYLNSVVQEGYKLPKGPVIMSPDRTYAALRREVYLRKPEVFKMGCLRDIKSLFGQRETPFFAGFGNRFTDALSYRSVSIPQYKIFTINSNAEVSLDLLSLNTYRTGYVSMRELVDHFFPSVALLTNEGGEEFTDFNYWRGQPLAVDDFSASESSDSDGGYDVRLDRMTSRSEDDYGDMDASYLSRDSIDETGELMEASVLESADDDEDVLESSPFLDREEEGGHAFLSEEERRNPPKAEPDEMDDVDSPTALELELLRIESDITPQATLKPPVHGADIKDDLNELAHVLSSPVKGGRAQGNYASSEISID